MSQVKDRKRGRPKSSATLERERIKEMFAQMPPFLPNGESELMRQLKASMPQVEEIERQILRDYKHDASVPSSHAYAMASVGDEAMSGYDSLILAQDEAHRQRIANQRKSGTNTQKKNARDRAEKIVEKNKLMLSELVGARGKSVCVAAKKIRGEWSHVTIAQRVKGEVLTARGDANPAPSLRTLREWITRRQIIPTNNDGKGSLP